MLICRLHRQLCQNKLEKRKVINFLCSFPPSSIWHRAPVCARAHLTSHSTILRRRCAHQMNAWNVSMSMPEKRIHEWWDNIFILMKIHIHTHTRTQCQSAATHPSRNECERLCFVHENYAMHVFNRNKNNYIFVVSTMIRCVNTPFEALAWALMRFDFSFCVERMSNALHT